MARKPVVPPALADALTEDKPRADNRPVPAARAVSVISGEGLDDVSAKDTDTLAAEIIGLQVMGNRVLLAIGRRLIAAKDKLSHGDWLPWLDSVNIPERLAQRYMKLAREWTNPTILSDLGMSRALTLLALPETEREEFIAEAHVVDGEEKRVTEMSNAELKAAIQAKQNAERRLSELETRLDEALAHNKTLYNDLNESVERRNALQAELAELKAKPVDVAIQTVVDPAAIEEAKREVREEMQFLIITANASRDKAVNAREKAYADCEAAKADADTARINAKVAQSEAEKARQDAEAARGDAGAVRVERDHARQELADARAELERVRTDAQKAASLADKDLSLFSVLFEQTQSAVNQMRGVLLKQPPDKQAGLKKALNDLADAVRKAAE